MPCRKREEEKTSMISEQVKELREVAEMYEGLDGGDILREAADTIESLSAKLKDMERSTEDCGGWIPCKNKPERKRDESSRPVLVRYKDETANPDVCKYNFLTGKFVFIEKDVTEFVKEWREIPGYEP